MSNTDADTAISALDKLIDQELATVRHRIPRRQPAAL